MKTKEEPNEHGTITSFHICDTCGEPFSVTPAAGDAEGWDNCLAEGCASYDPNRDVDAAFDSDDELEQRTVVGLAALRLRRKIQNLE